MARREGETFLDSVVDTYQRMGNRVLLGYDAIVDDIIHVRRWLIDWGRCVQCERRIVRVCRKPSRFCGDACQVEHGLAESATKGIDDVEVPRRLDDLVTVQQMAECVRLIGQLQITRQMRKKDERGRPFS